MKPTMLVALLLVGSGAHAAVTQPELADLTLEELADIRVTSVSRRSELLADTPASVFVITGDEIRRAGALTLPEALRLAPNLQVARIDARNYAVTARGFNNGLENKLLVMIDGRTIYSPLFSGVFWDAQDLVIEDIERIEVISGPGATMWGANAVNGVISVITRSAADTQGSLASVSMGREFRDLAVRHGGKLEGGGQYRVYGKFAENENSERVTGIPQPDGWHRKQAGFRADWNDGGQQVSLQGNTYTARLRQLNTVDIAIGGANLTGRLGRTLDDGSSLQVQAFYDHTERDQPGAFREHLDTFDIEVQRAMVVSGRHHLVFGGGYRFAMDRLVNGPVFGFLPASLDMHWANLFIEDTIDVTNKLQLILGHKVERNIYTGVEQLPNIRLAWKAAPGQLWWTSVSRAVRAPSRIDRDFFSPSTPRPAAPRFDFAGGPNFRSEVARVLEAGYRAQPRTNLSFAATAFYARYDRLRTLEPGANGAVFLNNAVGDTRGLELNASWRPRPTWRLTGGLVAQRIESRVLPGVTDLSNATALANNDPSSYWQLRSSWDLDGGSQFDMSLRHVGALARAAAPAYTALDARYAWQVDRNLEVAVIGQNLLERAHVEFGPAATGSEFRRGAIVKATWRQ